MADISQSQSVWRVFFKIISRIGLFFACGYLTYLLLLDLSQPTSIALIVLSSSCIFGSWEAFNAPHVPTEPLRTPQQTCADLHEMEANSKDRDRPGLGVHPSDKLFESSLRREVASDDPQARPFWCEFFELFLWCLTFMTLVTLLYFLPLNPFRPAEGDLADGIILFCTLFVLIMAFVGFFRCTVSEHSTRNFPPHDVSGIFNELANSQNTVRQLKERLKILHPKDKETIIVIHQGKDNDSKLEIVQGKWKLEKFIGQCIQQLCQEKNAELRGVKGKIGAMHTELHDLSEKMKERKKEIQSKNNEIQNLQHEIDQWRHELRNIEMNISSGNIKVQHLQQDMQDSKLHLQGLQESIKDNTNELQGLQKMIDQKNSELQTLRTKTDQVSAKLNIFQENNQKRAIEVQNLQKKLNQEKDNFKEMRSRYREQTLVLGDFRNKFKQRIGNMQQLQGAYVEKAPLLADLEWNDRCLDQQIRHS